MSGMVKGSSLSVGNALALLTVPVAAVLVHRGSAQAQGPQPRRARRAAVSPPPLLVPPPALRQRRQLRLVVLMLRLPATCTVAHHLTQRERRTSGMVKESSLSVGNASALLTVPVAAVLVHRGSAQAQGPQLRRVRRDVGLSQLRDSSGYKKIMPILGVKRSSFVHHFSLYHSLNRVQREI
jgi:hypothetical protein